jgi:DNA-binding winged helix-turn-helix (wHTH) protein
MRGAEMIYSFAGVTLDEAAHRVMRDGHSIPVEPQVFDILRLLAENGGSLVSKEDLIDAVWGGRIVSEATISARINAARKAVGDSGSEQRIIRTVQRRGFQMVAEVMRIDAPSADASATIHQTIRYTSSADGASIAWSTAGDGPPLLYAWHHLSHLEQDWSSGLFHSHFLSFAERYRLLRYDMRGTGLSDPLKPEDRFEHHVEDLLAVANAAGLSRFPILATLQSAAFVIRLAATHPERVSCLVLHNGYARGRSLRENAPEAAENDPFISLLNSGGWGDPDNGFMRAWATMVLPMSNTEETTEIIRLIAHAGSTQDALLQRRILDTLDVRADLETVEAPTLVIHSRMGAVHPVAEGRRLAAGIPGAEFLEVDSSNTFFLPTEPAYDRVLSASTEFLDRHAGYGR